MYKYCWQWITLVKKSEITEKETQFSENTRQLIAHFNIWHQNFFGDPPESDPHLQEILWAFEGVF